MSGLAYAEVIGDPIAHSRSPAIHRFWLEQAGLSYDYRACRVGADDLPAYFEHRRRDPQWRGCNITVPHKVAALACADDVDAVAGAIGATNCVVRTGAGRLRASNTDAAGFDEPIATLDLAGREAVVIGAGGAARAVLVALRERGIGRVTVLNRSIDKAATLLAELGIAGDAAPLVATLPPAALLVNASTLGMSGQRPLELDLRGLPASAVVYDIVYAPLETGLLRQARELGLATIGGLDMLVGQAAVAFELFFGCPAPRQDDAGLRRLLTA